MNVPAYRAIWERELSAFISDTSGLPWRTVPTPDDGERSFTISGPLGMGRWIPLVSNPPPPPGARWPRVLFNVRLRILTDVAVLYPPPTAPVPLGRDNWNGEVLHVRLFAPPDRTDIENDVRDEAVSGLLSLLMDAKTSEIWVLRPAHVILARRAADSGFFDGARGLWISPMLRYLRANAGRGFRDLTPRVQLRIASAHGLKSLIPVSPPGNNINAAEEDIFKEFQRFYAEATAAYVPRYLVPVVPAPAQV